MRRLVGHYFDQPEAARGNTYANAMMNSGAGRILLPYRIRRLGLSGKDAVAEAMATGSVGNPIVDLQVVSGQLVVSYSDGTVTTLDLPAGMGGDVDPAAVQVLIDTHTAQANAHHIPPST